MTAHNIFSTLTPEEVNRLKVRFAEAQLRTPENAFLAAQEIFGTEVGRALYAATHWVDDPEVLAEKSRLLSQKGARAFLPTKEDYAREVWKLAIADRTPVEDKARMFSLFGDIMGYKEQANKNTGGITVNNNKVMIVRDHGSDADWERRAAAQQHQLTNGNVIDVAPRLQ